MFIISHWQVIWQVQVSQSELLVLRSPTSAIQAVRDISDQVQSCHLNQIIQRTAYGGGPSTCCWHTSRVKLLVQFLLEETKFSQDISKPLCKLKQSMVSTGSKGINLKTASLLQSGILHRASGTQKNNIYFQSSQVPKVPIDHLFSETKLH